jgi:aquaporin Z
MVVWHWNHYLVEFIGTFCLTFTIGCAVNIRSPDVTETGLAIGLALTLLVYSGGYISGAHYNPAVSIAGSISGSFTRSDTFVFLILTYFPFIPVNFSVDSRKVGFT